MKLLLLFCFLAVQSNAFRVPLPYGTGIPSGSSGQDIGNQGIFHRILTWLADDNSVHENKVSAVSQNEFLDGFDEFVQEMKEMEERTEQPVPLPIPQVLKDSILKVKNELLSMVKQRPHLAERSGRAEFEHEEPPSFIRL
eukprot:00797.XXX_2278_2759_1 [CDS] Oithona nana genome sequencing.